MQSTSIAKENYVPVWHIMIAIAVTKLHLMKGTCIIMPLTVCGIHELSHFSQ